MKRILLTAAVFCLLALPAQAADVMAGTLKISAPWARATPKGASVGGGMEIKPGQTVTLAPGGFHVMLVGLKQQLKDGEHFKATLEFAKAGKVDVDFTVEGLGATHSGGTPGSQHDMGGMKMK